MSFKPEEHSKDSPPLSPWWMRTIGIVMVIGFAVLLAITYLGYRNAPPIPGKVVGSDGKVLFTKADVGAGQSVFLKHGLMNNGSIWGHGAYLGPDFSAVALHTIGMDSADILAREQFNRPFDQLDSVQQASITAQVAVILKTNRYDPQTDTLTLTPAETMALGNQPGYWKEYFSDPLGKKCAYRPLR